MGRKPKVPGDSIRDALKKATTEMMTLCLLQERPMYTYELMQLFEERSQGAITFSTLYQTIYRLQAGEYIQEFRKTMSEDNRVRIYFAVTDEGRDYLTCLIQEYRLFTDAVDKIVGLNREGGGSACKPPADRAPPSYGRIQEVPNMKGQVIFLWTKRPSWKELEAQLHPYLRQLERLLDCPAADRRRCLKDTLRMAKDFADGSPAPSREEILKFLGTPQEVAENFLETLDPDVLRRHRAKKVWLRRGLAVLAVATILFLAASVALLLNRPMEVQVQDTLVIYEEVPKT